METTAAVFEENYALYLGELASLPLAERIRALGGSTHIPDGFPEEVEGVIPFLGRTLGISRNGIVDEHGRRPGYEICVILCRHLIMCPDSPSQETDWVSFKDLKDGGPLTVYFRDNVDQVLIQRFSSDVDGLRSKALALGGTAPDLSVQYDVAFQIQALPKLPVVLLFNGADDEFPADCSILFQRRVEEFLDAECIAMLGYRLARELGR